MDDETQKQIVVSAKDFKKLKDSGILQIEEDVSETNDGTFNAFVEEETQKPFKCPKIRKLSEDLNANFRNCRIYDPNVLTAGLIVYSIETVEPSIKCPYATYKPSIRVITGIHGTDSNNGCVFFSYKPKVSQEIKYGKKNVFVYSEPDTFYTPLTKQQAEYICKLLNFQSKQFYKNAIKNNNNQK